MKNYAYILVFLFVSTFSFSQSKVGTIDVNYILSKMPELKTVNDSLNAYGTRLDKQITIEIERYQQLIDEYTKNESTYSQSALEEKQLEILTLENNINKLRQNAIQLIQLKDDDLKRPLYEKIGQSLEKVAKSGGYTQVLSLDMNSNVVYIDDQYDLTDSVLQDLGLPID